MQRLDEFMGDALFEYYNNNDPFGVDGDFTTAPEISQLFGEIIGIWAIQKWIEIGSPSSFNLIEIGPGRGTLMTDLLHATQHVDPFYDALNLHLIETSDTLKRKQKNILKKYDVQWHVHLSSVPSNTPAIIIGNEFFDALPVRQFKFKEGKWFEHYIDSDQSVWLEFKEPPLRSTLPKPKNNDVFEYSKIQQDYAELISKYNGYGLFIDYGYQKSTYGDTLQALQKHAPCSITDNIGNVDLTTHIDFEWLSSFFKQTKIKTQRQFLKENGIDIRYQTLRNPELKSGYERLINQDQMGCLFNVLEINLLQKP